jgi:hypothetical protein
VKQLLDFRKKELSLECKEEEYKTFEDLKYKLLSAPMLRFSDFVKPFEVHTNANDFTIGGVFMQDGHPIAFESKKFCGA